MAELLRSIRSLIKDNLGPIEEMILVTMSLYGKPVSARDIRNDIEKNVKRMVSTGVIYAALERLEKKDFIISYVEQPTNKRGGRSKNMFSITEDGKKSLLKANEINNSIWKDFNNRICLS